MRRRLRDKSKKIQVNCLNMLRRSEPSFIPLGCQKHCFLHSITGHGFQLPTYFCDYENDQNLCQQCSGCASSSPYHPHPPPVWGTKGTFMLVHGSTSSTYGGPSVPPLATTAPISLPPAGSYAPVQVMIIERI
ncbi:hypothetical protein MKW98_028633 [Papaver atlanticum]|uniref:Uncharacterized protein n=1 Tax=Papaver atlanticum TaxID=357466 RepID=A0AAD4SBQ7_9MAGN|nr:hypothetical protein MKW98_028633 [Papaver atlanticum]